ncbi:DUF6230 family protein [Streptomyces albireticuli]|uniref:Cholesterol esterase n=1 Tax=Streptomyces albireticuli TaxID=1940 RepID=A0A2A2DF73_9ACTN|nr:DUF6230 family protein [Streptomyces albireticuli]MCD9141946.1 DUF6230 family protein [Streptomyces albireticuli]MCD9163110.1 DUF6230 family protein [Streptomyces albireticuli]MCD9190120.1 DUF6230 family protein [Streptomyces albireticuli]PAU50141.1 cholesterol esterase [Streptomyces albireticuli]
MQDAQGRPVTGRVKWRKFAVLAVPGFAATAALAVALAQGAIAASFAVSGQQFKISADSLAGTGFAQYGGVDVNAHDELIPVAVTSIKRAELKKLCQSVVMRLPILGAVSLNLHAGGGDKPVQATDLFLDATQMSGDAEFTNIEIGRDASTLDKGPEGAQGMTDVFAQQADKVQMTKVRQTAWATNAGSFRLNGLDMKVLKGERECF